MVTQPLDEAIDRVVEATERRLNMFREAAGWPRLRSRRPPSVIGRTQGLVNGPVEIRRCDLCRRQSLHHDQQRQYANDSTQGRAQIMAGFARLQLETSQTIHDLDKR